MRSITRATIVFFVAAGVLGALSVAIFLLGPQIADVLGSGIPHTVTVVAAWVLAAASALLVYHGLMRAAAEQDEAAARHERELRDWHDRETPRQRRP